MGRCEEEGASGCPSRQREKVTQSRTGGQLQPGGKHFLRQTKAARKSTRPWAAHAPTGRILPAPSNCEFQGQPTPWAAPCLET